MSLSDYIDDVLPGWMKKLGREHWPALANTVAHVADAMLDGLYEGRIAAMPGQIDTPDLGGFESVDALSLVGRDRRLVRGPNETPWEYAARLRKWWALWRAAATAVGLLGALRDVMVPSPPLLRVVSSAGIWWSLAEDGTLTRQTATGHGFSVAPDGTITADTTLAHPWDWDGNPDVHRIWPIIYAPSNAPYLSGKDGEWDDLLSQFRETSSVPVGTIGTTAPRNYVEMVRSIVDDWKPAGMTCSHIIIAFDPDSFDPATPGPFPAPGMPDGKWKDHGKLVPGVGDEVRRVRARNATARYWRCTS